MKLLGKAAIITGGSRGIGKAIALEFAREGANIVVVVDKDIESANKVVREVENMGNKGLVAQADVAKRGEVDKITEATLKNFGRIDILVNNAGLSHLVPAIELSEEEWNRVIGVNLSGVFFCSQSAARIMIQQKEGKIINISSIMGVVGAPNRASYASSKSGVIALTKVLAIEWAQYNIRVNTIAPGYVETQMFYEALSKGLTNRNALIRRIPMGRFAKPDEIAKVAAFLASDDSDYITGETICVDGGWVAYGYV